jgi:hypothetical protein
MFSWTDPSQLNKASWSWVGVRTWPSLTMQDHPAECLYPSSAGAASWETRETWTMGQQPCLLSSVHLNSYHLDWPLQGFPNVLNFTREPLLGPPHSHTLYHTPTNRSGVISTHILPRFARLLGTFFRWSNPYSPLGLSHCCCWTAPLDTVHDSKCSRKEIQKKSKQVCTLIR